MFTFEVPYFLPEISVTSFLAGPDWNFGRFAEDCLILNKRERTPSEACTGSEETAEPGQGLVYRKLSWLAEIVVVNRHSRSPSFGTVGDGNQIRQLQIVVVGGRWAGFGAAHTLAKAGVEVSLLDAALSPGDLSIGFRSAKGKPVEAGIKRFW
ncbi:hypothetical protein SUGI_0816460 [Cryptomeria japonica]|nr:hypothetical protein SUGI_0816460 [Cryptomeria japonica]